MNPAGSNIPRPCAAFNPTNGPVSRFFSAFFQTRSEVQRHGVHAVALTGRLRAVVENVTKVGPAGRAAYLGAHGAETGVFQKFHRVRCERLVKARPARTGIELRLRLEERRAARRTRVCAGFLV